jgi:hypothetical protein
MINPSLEAAISAVIYEWEAWEGYLLPQLLRAAHRLKAAPDDTLDQIVTRLPGDTNAFCFHLNCTKTGQFPLCRAELIEALEAKGIPVLNGYVTDTSKRSLQQACEYLGLPTVATREADGRPNDLVIVKTDLNYGGFGERGLSSADKQRLGIPVAESPINSTYDYKVLTRSSVPDQWWKDLTLVVERFVKNRYNRKFSVYFGGTAFVAVLMVSTEEIKKFSPTHFRQEFLLTEQDCAEVAHPDLPSGLQLGTVRLLRHYRVDVGAIDVVEDDDGCCYPIDLNPTTYARVSAEAIEHLHKGLATSILCTASRGRGSRYGMPRTSLVAEYVNTLLARETSVRQAAADKLPGTLDRPAPGIGWTRPAVIDAAYAYRSSGDLCALTCVFGFAGAATRLRNFAFASSLFQPGGPPLFVVECAIDDDLEMALPSEPFLRFRSHAALWQKERLLNEAIRQLPERFTKVAWIDADVLFANADWAVDASRLLDEFAVVQLCEQIVRLPRGRHAYMGHGEVWDSFAAVYRNEPNAMLGGDFGAHGHTGIGWAARRSVLEHGGLYDACIVGGADHFIAHAFCGDWESACITRMMGANSSWHRHASEWAKSVYPLVRAQMGVVPGAALHLWHGDMASRQHARRYEPLHLASFDPARDIERDEIGSWRWSGDKTDLYEAVGRYIKARRLEAAT